jgi:hypothetical protein
MWPLPCEDQHGRGLTSGDAVIVPPTLASSVAVCRLVLPCCREFAAWWLGLSCSS